jgi:hypothetical protein
VVAGVQVLRILELVVGAEVQLLVLQTTQQHLKLFEELEELAQI